MVGGDRISSTEVLRIWHHPILCNQQRGFWRPVGRLELVVVSITKLGNGGCLRVLDMDGQSARSKDHPPLMAIQRDLWWTVIMSGASFHACHEFH